MDLVRLLCAFRERCADALVDTSAPAGAVRAALGRIDVAAWLASQSSPDDAATPEEVPTTACRGGVAGEASLDASLLRIRAEGGPRAALLYCPQEPAPEGSLAPTSGSPPLPPRARGETPSCSGFEVVDLGAEIQPPVRGRTGSEVVLESALSDGTA